MIYVVKTRLLYDHHILAEPSVPIGSMYGIYGNIYHQYTPNVRIYTIHGSYGVGIMNISLAILLRQRNCFLFLLIGFWYLARQRPPDIDGEEGGKSQEQREERLFQGEAQGRMEKSPTTRPTIKQGKFNLYDDTSTNGKWEY